MIAYPRSLPLPGNTMQTASQELKILLDRHFKNNKQDIEVIIDTTQKEVIYYHKNTPQYISINAN